MDPINMFVINKKESKKVHNINKKEILGFDMKNCEDLALFFKIRAYKIDLHQS